jgi:uncharacterized protein HemX
MVKEAVETLGGWLYRNSWAMIVVLSTIIGSGVVTTAVQQNQMSNICKQVDKLESSGSAKAVDNSERIKALETIIKTQTEMLSEMRGDIKILLGR